MTSVLVRWPWLALYLVSNIVAAWVMYDTGLLIGDLAGLPLYSGLALAWALLLVLGCYLFILRPGFDFLCRIRVRPMLLRAEPGAGGNRLGWVLLVLQVAYFAFNSYFGVNVAGSGRTEGVPFAIFWVFMPVDALMVVYYGYHRDSRLFFPNAAVWVVSNLARGWSGIFFFILFLEWCRAARSGRLRLKWIIMLGVGVLLSYPLLINLKWIIRASAQTGFGLEQVGQGFAALFAAEDYGTLIWNGVLQIVARFQTVANVVETMRLSDLLQSEFDAGTGSCMTACSTATAAFPSGSRSPSTRALARASTWAPGTRTSVSSAGASSPPAFSRFICCIRCCWPMCRCSWSRRSA